MTTEAEFQAMLDANPSDGHTRMVFADWLQERDDPRAEGYRWMGMNGVYPFQHPKDATLSSRSWQFLHGGLENARSAEDAGNRHAVLPVGVSYDGLATFATNRDHMGYNDPSRRALEDRAANTIAKLIREGKLQ